MPTIESIKKDINSLGYADKEEILNYLEEVITFGAVSKEITKRQGIQDATYIPKAWTKGQKQLYSEKEAWNII